MAQRASSSKRFKKSPLRLVVCQLRFPLLLRLANADLVAEFHEAIAKDYPSPQREKQLTFRLTANGVDSSGDSETLYRFSEPTDSWSVVLGESQLTLEARKYTDHSDLLERFEKVLRAAVDAFEIKSQTRLGLRYINEFRRPGFSTMQQWGALLRKEFVGYAADKFEDPVTRTFHELQLTRADATFVIRHGLLSGTTVAPSPNSEGAAEPFYLLDLDHFDATNKLLAPDAVIKQLKSWENHSYEFFRWTLTEELFNALEPIDAAQH